MFIATSLSHYKRPDVQKALVAAATDKEVGVIFDGDIFGKRPDILSYENDVLELAKKKAASFHCSEELWHNPLAIGTGMKRHELDELRKGWDLILDIDCPDWRLSKLTTHLFIKALQDHSIKSISVKFSGNKGFHIAVPFESFPDHVSFEGETKKVKDLFPEGPRKIAVYLLSYLTEHYAKINNDKEEVVFDKKHIFSFKDLEKIANSTSVLAFRCVDCQKVFNKQPDKKKTTYQCAKCGHVSKPNGSPEVISCEKCNYPVSPSKEQSQACPHCRSKKSPQPIFNVLSVVEVDTVLISSRHLYRMPYSLHEKSGLVSIPIKLDDVLDFDKNSAIPENISFSAVFLDRSSVNSGEATQLLQESLSKELLNLKHIHADTISKSKTKSIALPEEAISEDFFPPCMHNILRGLEDGKKRALFILINFLRVSGWDSDAIKDYVYKWNERNPEPLREQYLKGQLSQIKKSKKPLPPPNCNNGDYYTSLQVCKPDAFCPRINNPAMYAKRKAELANKPKKGKPKKPSKAKKT